MSATAALACPEPGPVRLDLADMPDEIRFSIGLTIARARGREKPGVEIGLWITYFANQIHVSANPRSQIAASIYKRAKPDDIDARAAAACMERVEVPEGSIVAIVNDDSELFRVELYEENQ